MNSIKKIVMIRHSKSLSASCSKERPKGILYGKSDSILAIDNSRTPLKKKNKAKYFFNNYNYSKKTKRKKNILKISASKKYKNIYNLK